MSRNKQELFYSLNCPSYLSKMTFLSFRLINVADPGPEKSEESFLKLIVWKETK